MGKWAVLSYYHYRLFHTQEEAEDFRRWLDLYGFYSFIDEVEEE